VDVVCLCYGAFHLIGLAHITCVERQALASGQLVGSTLQSFLAASKNGDARAELEEFARHGQSEPGTATCDERDFARE
jgi:hypothetical protein